MTVNSRKLTGEEISFLEKSGCSAESWGNVSVSEGFSPKHIRNVHFAGKIVLGADVHIDNVGLLSDYIIGDGTELLNIGKMSTGADSLFGNGVEVKVLNETGGREVVIYENISSQIAYMMALYRYDSAFIEALKSLIDNTVKKYRSSVGIVGKNVLIENVKSIDSVKIGDGAIVSGADILKNGTVVSAENAVSIIGTGVVCRDFIMQTKSQVTDYAMIESCFVGQGCILSKGFTASQSLFFANSHLENGEGVSLFAGPYTVSHHKSTLLIGTMFSFMNAGSSTNFSNHLYKSGPVHQGIFGRGVKCASGSYMMLPVKIGAFSTIIGHHSAHVDTSDFPYSYIVEKEGKTKLIPGVALTNSGLFRDAGKWPSRDRRSKENMLDNIDFDIVNPVTWAAMKRGLDILRQLSDKVDFDDEIEEYNGFYIDGKSIRRGIEIYSDVLEEYPFAEFLHLRKKYGRDYILKIATGKDPKFEKWVDLSGMIAPYSKIKNMVETVGKKNLKNLFELDAIIRSIYESYDYDIIQWLAYSLPEELIAANFERSVLEEYLAVWKEKLTMRLEKILKDAEKEYSAELNTGFGMDGDEKDIENDIMAVRGAISDSPLCKSIIETIDKVQKISL